MKSAQATTVARLVPDELDSGDGVGDGVPGEGVVLGLGVPGEGVAPGAGVEVGAGVVLAELDDEVVEDDPANLPRVISRRKQGGEGTHV